jgi:hypothetical protein
MDMPLKLDDGMEKWRLKYLEGSMFFIKYLIFIGQDKLNKGTCATRKQDIIIFIIREGT